MVVTEEMCTQNKEFLERTFEQFQRKKYLLESRLCVSLSHINECEIQIRSNALVVM